MSFFCAGSSGEALRKKLKPGSKPGPPPVTKSSSNGRVANPFQDVKKQPLPSIPFSDHPNSRRMTTIQDYIPDDNRGLAVKRGEQVQVLSQEGTWYFVRNEYKKEGFVPSSHLVAPYTSTRSRKSNSHPMRPVASGSSINDVDQMNRGVPMHPSHSAGRPLNMVDENHMNRANTFGGRGTMEQVLTAKDTSNNNNAQLSQGMTTGHGITVTMYEQKHSPSSSSGVASMIDPPSPIMQTFPEQANSQENIGRHSSGSSLTQERTSLSSIEEREMTHDRESGYHVSSGVGSTNEEVGIPSRRTTSESNLAHMKVRPLPYPPQHPDKEGVYLDHNTYHIYSTITNGEGPPPVPPRTRAPVHSASQGDQFYPDVDMYTAPVDAVMEQPGPHLDRPRVYSLNDVRSRDGYRRVQSNKDYSEVYQGKLKPPSRQNGYHHGTDTGSDHSEGGSSNRSSKKSSSSRRGYSDRMSDSREGITDVPPQSPVVKDSAYLVPVSTQLAATRIAKFRKCLWGVYIVIQTFESQDENELSVCKGDQVSVWNQDDQEWFWIVNHTSSEEGFVPSCFLQEVVASDVPGSNTPTILEHQHSRPPIPPKQYPQPPHHHHTDDQSQFRIRSSSQDSRSSQPGRYRGRLHSDGSSRSRSSSKANGSLSATNIENMDISGSPPNTPPPPYSAVDHYHSQPSHSNPPHPTHPPHSHQAPHRHFSLSQQHEPSHSAGYTTQILRTRSQGHVMYQGRRGNPPSAVTRRDDRLPSPAEVFNLRSPTAVNDGTLV